MNQEIFRVIELSQQGFNCSQVLLQMGLEAQGKSDPDLIRAVYGLAWGIGFTNNVCGVLSGGACLLSLYAGKGTPEEEAHENIISMIRELVQWFKDDVGTRYGGINCNDILGEDSASQGANCGNVVVSTYLKVVEILNANGIPLSGKPVDSE